MLRFTGILAVLIAIVSSGSQAAAGADHRESARVGGSRPDVKVVQTGRRAERLETIPISARAGRGAKSVLSVKLPDLTDASKIDLNGEVTISTTCVEQISRCIGRSYNFDPHLRAWVVLAAKPDDSGGRKTVRVGRPVSLTCEQTRPNRNHHCPLVVEKADLSFDDLRDLPCRLDGCRLNMLVSASSKKAAGGEVVVVGSDQVGGTVEGGKARLGAVVTDGKVTSARHSTRRERIGQLPASFENGKQVVYSQRLGNLRRGDALIVRARQRSSIRALPYFISDQVVISTRPRATRPSAIARRAVSRTGTVTETNGFNCTLGPSAFSSPCLTRKAGVASIERVPQTKIGKPKALYVNLVSRGFPKLAQARMRGYAPVEILDGGYLSVTRLRAR